MKLGHVTASLLLQMLQAYPQQNALAQPLQEYGIGWSDTLHVLRWYADRDDRRRVMRQLNKGESLHDLRAYLMIANKGRTPEPQLLANQASCLNLVTNAVILWNTVYMAEAVAQLRREGYQMAKKTVDLARVWPTRYGHLNVYARFHFDNRGGAAA